MPKGKRSWINRLPTALPIWIGVLIIAVLLINTGEQLKQLGGVMLALLVVAGMLSHFVDR